MIGTIARYVILFREWLAKEFGQRLRKYTGVLAPLLGWFLLLVVFVGILYVLYLLNDAINLARWLPDFSPKLKPFYAPLLGLIVILGGVVVYFFLATWDTGPDQSPFPDIDEAWDKAMASVREAGILPQQVSLFLVLGRPESAETNLFEANNVKWVVKSAPNDPAAPIHIYAEKESSPKSPFPGALYVTCRGASVLGKLAGVLARDETVVPAAVAFTGESSENAGATVGAVDRDAIKAKEIVALAQGREATVLEKRKAHRAERGKPLGSDLLADSAEVTRLKARLAHLCSLIARERGSECAANGILVLIPLAGTDTNGEAQLTAQACLEDLTIARNEMRIDCPVVTMLVDLEDLPGFGDFLGMQRPKELGSRRGGSFPMATRLSREELRQQIRTSLSWVCTTYLQDSIYSVYKSESDAVKEVAPLFSANARLTMLLAEMNERAESVCDIVLTAMLPEKEPMFRYSGFYLAATGVAGMQGFVAGVFQKLVKEQAGVTWTEAALERDTQNYASASNYATATYALLALLVVVAAAFVFVLMRPS